MKKFLVTLLICVLVCSTLVSCGKEKEVLKVYNAGEYIDKSLLTDFEKEFNCKIIYDTFDSNESMYTKLSSGETYDILVPSDYMIERLIKEDFLQPVDKSKIPNMKNIMDKVMEKDEYDEDHTYSVPYFWGNVGILYNKNNVDQADLQAGWEILRNEKYKNRIYMYDSERDSFMVALKALGLSMNTDKKEDLDKAYNWLVEQSEKVSPVYVGDDVIDSMISSNKDLAVVYSGDGAYIMTENPDMGFSVPAEGTNTWYDGMVITKDCENTDLAHKFINFMLEEENAYSNSLEVGYTSPVKYAYEKLYTETYEGNNAYSPEAGPYDEVFGYQTPEIKQYSAELWIKVKAN